MICKLFRQDFGLQVFEYKGNMKQNQRFSAYICWWPEIFRPQNELEEGKAGGIPASGDEIGHVLSRVMGSDTLSGKNNARIVAGQVCKTAFVWKNEQGKRDFCCNGILLLLITEYISAIVPILHAPLDRKKWNILNSWELSWPRFCQHFCWRCKQLSHYRIR